MVQKYNYNVHNVMTICGILLQLRYYPSKISLDATLKIEPDLPGNHLIDLGTFYAVYHLPCDPFKYNSAV